MIRIRDIIKYWWPEDFGEKLVVIISAIILMVLLGVAIERSIDFPGQEKEKEIPQGQSSILILRESVVNDPNYGNVILIDYMIDGWQTNAYFRPGEESKYEQFWAELEKLGKVQR